MKFPPDRPKAGIIDTNPTELASLVASQPDINGDILAIDSQDRLCGLPISAVKLLHRRDWKTAETINKCSRF